jgi:hypothetical protein
LGNFLFNFLPSAFGSCELVSVSCGGSIETRGISMAGGIWTTASFGVLQLQAFLASFVEICGLTPGVCLVKTGFWGFCGFGFGLTASTLISLTCLSSWVFPFSSAFFHQV